MAESIQSLEEVVRSAGSTIGISNLTMDQENAICSFVRGKDVFVCLPTGSGKSLCYAILPLVFDTIRGLKGSLCLVVSPLNALIKDQVATFRSKGLHAGFAGAAQADRNVLLDIRQGRLQLVYVTPEAIVYIDKCRSMLLERVWQDNLVAFIIDEAHCIKTW